MTDGLDGLAIVPVMITAASLALIAYLVGTPNYSREFALPQIDQCAGTGPDLRDHGRRWPWLSVV